MTSESHEFACNESYEGWSGSSRGHDVDVTAPGEGVWKAAFTGKEGQSKTTVLRGNGTSFAVATAAGVAALWLAYWGRESLINYYGRENLVSEFKKLLMKTCNKNNNLKKNGKWGAGIVDAEKLLSEKVL